VGRFLEHGGPKFNLLLAMFSRGYLCGFIMPIKY